MNVEIFYNFHLERGRDMSCGPFSIRVGLYHELQAAGIKYIYIYIYCLMRVVKIAYIALSNKPLRPSINHFAF